MRMLTAGVALTMLLGAPLASMAVSPRVTASWDAANVIVAVGGTPASNAYFVPGTGVPVDDVCDPVGVPQKIPQGSDVTFVNADSVAVANAHKIRSCDRRFKIVKKRKKNGAIKKVKVDMGPLFQSKYSEGPEVSTMTTNHVKPGVYAYVCSIHHGMSGLLEVVP